MNRPLALLVAGTFFMENLDATIIATAAPAIAGDLGVVPVDVNAAMTAYLVAVAAGLPASGWLTDRFGARRVLLVAVAVFAVASLACALSVSLPTLVVARAVQGVGGALMVPVGRLAVLRATTKAEMIDAIAYLTWPALLAPVIAPLLGGWIVTVASWHWIFLINLPLSAVAFVVGARIVPQTRSTVPHLDWVGLAICAALLVSVMVGIEVADPASSGGVSPSLMVLLVSTLALAAGGWAWFRRAPHPLLRFGALRVASFRVSNAGGSVYRMIISAVPFLVPLMLQVEFGRSAVAAGSYVLLLFLGNVLIKPATSPLLRRYGFRSTLVASITGGLLVLIAIAMLRPTTPAPLIAGVLVLSGVFRSVGLSAYNSLQFADIDPVDLPDANTLSLTLQQVAAGLGVAVGALLLRVSAQASHTAAVPLVTDYGLTFVLLAVIMLQPLLEVLRLPRSAGAVLIAR